MKEDLIDKQDKIMRASVAIIMGKDDIEEILRRSLGGDNVEAYGAAQRYSNENGFYEEETTFPTEILKKMENESKGEGTEDRTLF